MNNKFLLGIVHSNNSSLDNLSFNKFKLEILPKLTPNSLLIIEGGFTGLVDNKNQNYLTFLKRIHKDLPDYCNKDFVLFMEDPRFKERDPVKSVKGFHDQKYAFSCLDKILITENSITFEELELMIKSDILNYKISGSLNDYQKDLVRKMQKGFQEFDDWLSSIIFSNDISEKYDNVVVMIGATHFYRLLKFYPDLVFQSYPKNLLNISPIEIYREYLMYYHMEEIFF